ncbi:MAG: 50S ribosomal protein L11 methyltransferase [Bacteroidales bacterium]|nr:50S ribosomal protein L11 methyltransferase [Bacteroidales bacterium]
MAYIEIKLTLAQAEPWKDVFTSLLADAGCDSFMDGESENILLAYIKEELYDAENIRQLLQNHGFDTDVSYEISHIEEQDWNAVWEASYEPVTIVGRCHIRAPFHEPCPNMEYEIIIEPKMSFGTAHHETTSLMIEYILEEDFTGKSVLDMGSGTGVLSILARKRGATPVVAIDNDPWAYENNIENNARNGINDITVKLGDASAIGEQTFDVIIANINRNILLNDMHLYARSMHTGSIIFFSGFYQGHDLDTIRAKAATLGLEFVSNKIRNEWTAAKFVKVTSSSSL